jgi:hypothetical protein
MCIRNNSHNIVYTFEQKTSVTVVFTLAGTLDTVTVTAVSQDVTLKIKRPESEASQSPPSIAEVKCQQSYTSFPLTCPQLNLFQGHIY